ncbi:MAG TPA: hypothetical protein VFK05_06525 [Polyangiaceae bacterium]|nr:hypothetical protein [Polyangiaceae bacterium]
MKRVAMGSVVAVSMVLSAVAWAGYKGSVPTTVSRAADGSGYAYGNLGHARNSANAVEYIFCSVTASAGTTTQSMGCSAINAAGVAVGCYSYDEKLIRAAAAVGTDGQIYFTWDASSLCKILQVTHGSHLEPKAP